MYLVSSPLIHVICPFDSEPWTESMPWCLTTMMWLVVICFIEYLFENCLFLIMWFSKPYRKLYQNTGFFLEHTVLFWVTVLWCRSPVMYFLSIVYSQHQSHWQVGQFICSFQYHSRASPIGGCSLATVLCPSGLHSWHCYARLCTETCFMVVNEYVRDKIKGKKKLIYI